MIRFRKKPVVRVQPTLLDPAALAKPTGAADFLMRGMLYYARNQYALAETDFREAITFETVLIDGFYCLGMVLKAQGKKEEAVASFRQVIGLIDTRPQSDYFGNMLRRLALGHINKIMTGDWNLEKEIWRRET